jgi:methionyl aminopeptidase
MHTRTKSSQEIAAMRVSGKMLATVLQVLKKEISAGMSTKDLAIQAEREINALGGKPTFLGYYGFPDVICISVNDEVVHGIPSAKRILNESDVVGLDFGVTYEGMITDSAISVLVGDGPSKLKKLISETEASLAAGIATLKDGVKVGDIAASIEQVLNEAHLGIVRDLVGHGVGHQLHEEPNIPNYGRAGTGPALKQSMTIAIEPMATLGGYKVFIDDDNWTVKTQDGSIAAHFEHTVLITDRGAEILTIC